MPTFDFDCKGCSGTFEELVLGAEEIQCPECGSTRVEKRVSAGKLGVSGRLRGGVNVPATGSAPPSRPCSSD